MTILGNLNNKQIERVCCGNSYSLAMTGNGEVYAWGIGKSGSLGLGEIVTVTKVPILLSFKCNRDESIDDEHDKKG